MPRSRRIVPSDPWSRGQSDPFVLVIRTADSVLRFTEAMPLGVRAAPLTTAGCLWFRIGGAEAAEGEVDAAGQLFCLSLLAILDLVLQQLQVVA